MIASIAVMALLMQENQRRGGWGRDPNEGGNGVLFLVLALMHMVAFAIVWVFA